MQKDRNSNSTKLVMYSHVLHLVLPPTFLIVVRLYDVNLFLRAHGPRMIQPTDAPSYIYRLSCVTLFPFHTEM